MAKEVGPVDVLVNNAGITRDMTFKKMTKADWDAVMHTNLDSVFNMTKQVMDGMMERGWGRVINISSVNGQKGAFGQTNYSAAKAGMHGFTKALALEVAKKGVTVNTISPGLHRHQDGDGDSAGSARHARSCRRFRSRGWASRKRWRAWWPTWPPRRRRSLPAPTFPSTAASTCIEAIAPAAAIQLGEVKMTQRVAFVTGAMGGLGTAICQAFAKDGYKVVAAYHPQFDNKDEWLKEMAAAGFKDFVCVAGDVSSLEDCQKMAAEAEANAGPIDILVNNAGITRDRMFAKMDKDQWDAVISTNLTSLFNMTKQVSAKMAERGWGRIINISSVNGVKGQAGQSNYSAAKAGVIGFTKALAQELATKGVTVNAIAPGYVATKMVMAIREDVLEEHHRHHPDEAPGQAGGNGRAVLLPGFRPGRLHDRRHHEHQRRPLPAISAACFAAHETPAPAGVSLYNCCTAITLQETHNVVAGGGHHGRAAQTDQEISEPPSLRHADQHLHHAGGRQGTGAASTRSFRSSTPRPARI